MLELDISFDDKALSVYNVTLSDAFDKPEDALYFLLNGKPFRVEKMNQVYIIVPIEEHVQKSQTSTFSQKTKRDFVFTGTVADTETGETLCYATVSLLDHDEQPIITGIADENGAFCLSTPRFPHKIKISFVGYETLTKEILATERDLGRLRLQTTTVALNETVVTAANVRHKVDRTCYQVTSAMRRGVANVEELLNKIPGIYFDKVTNILSVNHSKDILLLADGIQQPADYLKNLSPDRVSSVEVINESSGRFVSDGYTAIINLVLKKDYSGYEVYASTFSALNTSGVKAYNGWVANRPTTGLVYTKDKINFYVNYRYNTENQKLSTSKNLTYKGVELLSDTLLKKMPNDVYKRESNAVTGGVNYQIAHGQVIGLQSDYVSGTTNTHRVYSMTRTDIQNQNKRIIKNTTTNHMSDKTWVATLFYQGQINSRLHLYSDFSYNYYFNDIHNIYDQNDALNYKEDNTYNEYKHHTLFNIESQYRLAPRVLINTGYSNAWREYGSESSHGKGFLDYREYRNKAFTYLMFTPSKKMHVKLGVAIEHLNSYDRNSKNSYTRVLPYIQTHFSLHEMVNLNASYSTNQHYPLLYQLSPMSMVIDTFLTQIGNPALKSAVKHTFSARISLCNRLTISPCFLYIHNEISELYVEKEYKLYRSFNNINRKEYSLQITYDQPIGDNFHFKNSISYYLGEALNVENKIKPDGWLVHSEIRYYHPVQSLGVQFGYYRNMKKQTLSHGYQMNDKDNWLVSIHKDFFRKRLSVALSYTPPISWGIRQNQLRMLETSLYKENTIHYLKSYNNMLLLKVSFRFDNGRSQTVKRHTTIKKSEREQKTITTPFP